MNDYLTSEHLTFFVCTFVLLVGFATCMKWLYKTIGMATSKLSRKYLIGLYWVAEPKGFLYFKRPKTAQEYELLLDIVHQLDLILIKKGELKGTTKSMHTDLVQLLDDAPFEYRNGQVVAC